MQKKKYVVVPNDLIDDTVMHYTAKIIYIILAFARRKSGIIKLTISELVQQSGFCEATVLQAIKELEESSFIQKKRNWRFSFTLNRVVNTANTYKLRENITNGYTLISSEILAMELTPATFCVLLFLYRCAGKDGRAYPSIRYISGAWKEKTGRGLFMGKSTVIRALKVLSKMQAIIKQYCQCQSGKLSANSYYMTASVLKHSQKSAETKHLFIGGSIFWDTSSINKITGDSLLRAEEIEGVPEFVILHETDASRVFEAETVFGPDRDIMPFWLPNPARPEGSQGNSCP